MKKSWSMQKKLMGMLMVVSAIAMTQISMMAYKQMVSVERGMFAMTKKVSSNILDKIDRNLFERYGDVQAFSVSEPARSGNPARIAAFMNEMMGMYAPVYDLMMVVNLEGRVIAANTVTKQGAKLDSSSLLGKDYSNSEWFKRAIVGQIEPGSAFVEDTHYDKEIDELLGTGGHVMTFTAPIRDRESGKVLGIWTNRMSWKDVVVQIIEEEEKALIATGYSHAHFTITDGDGKYLYNDDPEKAFKGFAPNFESYKGQKAPVSERINGFEAAYFKGDIYQGTAPSLGYSSYKGMGWYAQLQLPAFNSFVFWSWVQLIVGIFLQAGCWIFGWWLIRKLSDRLSSVMQDLEHGSEEVRSAATSITQGAANLASASNQQASALQETASSIEEMSAMVKRSADNASRSREVAETSHMSANQGKKVVDQMIQAIGEINTANDRIMNQVEDSNRQITEIVKVITEIGNKTKVINDIVFQTKLLSFNASVEAARAGEHGKGFAVVAEEVGNLAQMSGNAAKEIADMLNGSISKVEGIVADTKSKVERLIADGKSKVDSGRQVARQCGEILDDVVKNVSNVNSMVTEISTASREQASGIGEITKAMNQLDQVTHENAQTSQQAAGSAKQLAVEADGLSGLIQRLRSVVHGDGGSEMSQPDMPTSRVVAPKEPSVAPTPVKVELKPLAPETPKTVSSKASPRPPVKQVANSDVVPSEDDPRFVDF